MSASQSPTARLRSTDQETAAPSASRRTRARGDAILVLGRYRLDRRLGAGAFGTVWMARDERLERDVAVKIVPRERVVGGRLEREARAAARLAHPGIVTLYEAAADDDGAYLVSELVRGGTLDHLLSAGMLSDRDVVAIGIALCDALSYAHSQGVVHRDVKPSNILIPDTPASPAQIAKLTDFGVARVLGGDSLTRTGDVVGTAAYMAPEQAEGLEAGPPADLYALALVIYEGLTGVNPVRTGTAAQRARRLGAYLPPLRRQRRELPRALGAAVDLALRPRARERGTLAELRGALTEALAVAHDTPGVVTGAWPRGTTESPQVEPLRTPEHAPARSAQPQAGIDADALELATAPSWPARALAAVAAAGAAGWLTAHLLAPSPIAPAAAALVAGVVVAALPRLGWLGLTAVLAIGAALQGRPGGAAMIAILALIPVPFLPRDGVMWPLPAGATALGMIGLGGAWPAVAARANGTWRRGVMGAVGWLWLALAAPIAGAGLYLKLPNGTAPLAVWDGSVHQTVVLMLRPTVASGAIAAAPVWALASITLPWLMRGRSLAVSIVLVTAWSAAVVSATTTVIALVRPGETILPSGTAVAGAVAGALIALGTGTAESSPRSRLTFVAWNGPAGLPMSVLKSLESKIAGLVEGTFSRAFRSEVRPVEIARKLAREMEEHKSSSLSRTYVPNEYRVFLSPRDRQRFADYEEALSDELAGYLLEHARRERLALLSRPVIEFETDDRLGLGEFGIQTRVVQPPHEPEAEPVAEESGRTMIYSAAGRMVEPLEERARARNQTALLLHNGKRLVVGPAGIVLGRSRQCDVVLDDPNVSRQHAEIRPRGGSWVLSDLGSTNGSSLNGRRIDNPEVLKRGDQVELGTSMMTFELE